MGLRERQGGYPGEEGKDAGGGCDWVVETASGLGQAEY
jgi:hypothetical protein